jgi:hypothetical protein
MKVHAGRRCLRVGVLLFTSVFAAACAHAPPSVQESADGYRAELAFLVREGTADSLATASLLAHSDAINSGAAMLQPADLIKNAIALAPERPELIWIQLRDCDDKRCTEEMQIAKRLQTLDPGNGLAWLPNLLAAQARDSPAEATQAVAQIGAGVHMSIYWNALTVMIFDSLTHDVNSQRPATFGRSADARLSGAIGILAAFIIPPMQAMVRACRLDQFDEPGRRAACESMVASMETSDVVILQSLGLSLQEKWWPDGSPQREALLLRHRQQRYLMIASGKPRFLHLSGDAQTRIDAIRRTRREEDTERAMMTAFHEPLERPANWKSPYPGLE